MRATDTDVLVILIAMIGRHAEENATVHYGRIAMDCGVGDNRRYINVSAIQSKLEEKKPGSSTALLGLHSLTGCDYTSSFFNKGKRKALKIMLEDEESDDYIHALNSLSREGESEDMESFVCRLYA